MTDWWNENLDKPGYMDMYLSWLEDKKSVSRQFFVKWLKEKKIESIVDMGCGPCVDYFTLKEDNYDIDYLGVDSCTHLKGFNEDRGVRFLNAPIENTELPDNEFELAYSRHIWEHLPKFSVVLGEMIRISNSYVVHIFFYKPTEEKVVSYSESENLYHNHHSKPEIEDYLDNHLKVAFYGWTDIDDREQALIITLKEQP